MISNATVTPVGNSVVCDLDCEYHVVKSGIVPHHTLHRVLIHCFLADCVFLSVIHNGKHDILLSYCFHNNTLDKLCSNSAVKLLYITLCIYSNVHTDTHTYNKVKRVCQ